MQEKTYQEDYAELNLKDLFWSALCRWRVLLAAMIIVGAAFAAYGALRESGRQKNDVSAQSYQDNLASYERNKASLENALKNLRSAQSVQEYYQNNALLLQMNQYNVAMVTASYCVELETEYTPETYIGNLNYASALLLRYQDAVKNMDLDAVIADEANSNLTAVNPGGTNRRIVETSTTDNTILTVQVYVDNEARAEKVYAAIQRTIEEQHALLEKSAGPHRILQLSEQKMMGVDSEIGKIQTNFQNGVTTVSDGIAETTRKLALLSKPGNSAPSFKNIVKQAVKYGIVGAAAGLLVTGILLVFTSVLQNRLVGTEDIPIRYSVPLLGVYPGKKSGCSLDRVFKKRLGVDAGITTEEAKALTAANVRLYMKDSKHLLIVGNCSNEKMESVRKMLEIQLENVEIAVAGKINVSASAVDALRSGAAVVCVEEWMKTPHKEIRRELQTVEASDSRTLGLIVVC